MKGFTLFFAMLVAGLSLAIGLAIFDLTIRELDLSITATQSQYAIYAADTGAECALYWDNQYTAGGYTKASAFATSSASTNYATSHMPGVNAGLSCNGQDITAPSVIASFSNTPSTAPANQGWWVHNVDAQDAITEFWISMGASAASPCARVIVDKKGNPSVTTISSHGLNTCTNNGTLQLERALQVSY